MEQYFNDNLSDIIYMSELPPPFLLSQESRGD
jgi:hypothetical protein